MALRDSRFSSPSATALGMGALGVVSVGLISTGLWYDSHRSAQAVERAREQVSTAQTSQVTPEPVAVTTSERATESSTPASSTEGSEAPAPAEDDAGAGEVTVPSAVPVPPTAAPRAATAPQPVRQAPVQPAIPAAANPPAAAGGGTATTTDAPMGTGATAGEPPVEPTEPAEQEITQPVEPGRAPGALPGFIDLVRPFLPQANVAQPAPVADDGAADDAADDGTDGDRAAATGDAG
ncbi:hypothetical protein [Dietzia sp. PP-33]|jgi:hypothetical protein|uniref:hypothetical protein n=1 Tax=Dietzia sp. PP-33 TaxID=2957500 RepID=UPI0029A96237|nr:hypothetical protein [Dietzia sp. PP-33]MDX2357070.1 hypothetical protein [Dietzia sp. PP-33]